MVTIAQHLFARPSESKDKEEQLLKLFWNRAELKKELDRLRDESYVLTEQVRQQEAKTLRVQQRLEQLEARLGNPEHSATVVTFYQLRTVWDHCHERLAGFAAELERTRFDKAHRQHVTEFKQRMQASLTGVQSQLQEATEKGEELSARVKALREKRALRRGLWNFFRRRKLTNEINMYRQERRSVRLFIGELSEDIQSRLNQSPPEFTGLDVKAKREINLLLIACAQELYLHFADKDLSARAREAALRSLTDVSYGSVRECRSISKHVESRMKAINNDAAFQQRIKLRATHLAGSAAYRQDNETVAMAAGLGSIAILKNDGRVKSQVGINVLADEYWDVFSVLLV